MTNIYEIIEKMKRNLTIGVPVRLGPYATHDHAEKIAKIDAYMECQHISGPVDSIGRWKPFYGFPRIAVNTWYKATDIDRKNIRFKPTSQKNILKTFIASILLKNWMTKSLFGNFLNRWGYELAKYGSIVTKFVEKDRNLLWKIVPWSDIICDPLDFYDNPVIERIYYTPDQLLETSYDPEVVKEVIESGATMERRKTAEGLDKDTRADYIGVYEVHGIFPLSFLTGKEKDEKIYVPQMHAVFINGDVKKTLYKGREKSSPYHLAHLIDLGRTLSVGAVESIFEPIWMMNHTAKQIKDILDDAANIVYQTSDIRFMGKNIIQGALPGSIFVYEEGKPLIRVNNQSQDIPTLMSSLRDWKQLAREIAGIHEAITGQTMPSGTPYALGAMLNVEAHSLFEIMTENKGLYLEEMLRKFVVPFFKKQLAKEGTKTIATILDNHDIQKFDELALPIRLKDELIARIKEIPEPEELTKMIAKKNAQLGNLRLLSPGSQTWREYFSDLEWDAIEVEITGEQTDKQTALGTLNNLLQVLAANPTILQNPSTKKIFDKILVESGVISPLELTTENAVSLPAKIPELTEVETPVGASPIKKLTKPMGYAD